RTVFLSHALFRSLVAGTIAAGLLVGLGWGLGHWTATQPGADDRVESAAGEDKSTAVTRVGVSPISPLVAKHDLRLAISSTPTEQLKSLICMENDLRGEAVRLARQGARDELV